MKFTVDCFDYTRWFSSFTQNFTLHLLNLRTIVILVMYLLK